MPSIFISYRRNDSAQITQRIWENLIGVWGEEKVIKDTDTFIAGPDFREQMSRSIQRADVVLVVIGQHWLGTNSEMGSNRLFDETDPVRTEIEEAIKYKKVIIPVLVNTQQMPQASELPDSIRVKQFLNVYY